MTKPLPIPEQLQLQALATGLREVYILLADYLGDLNKAPDFRQYITVTKAQLSDYLRHHPELAERHIAAPDAPRRDDTPVLERANDKYVVFEMDHHAARYRREFEELADAAAEYLMWGW
jgi:hypothetical protein